MSKDKSDTKFDDLRFLEGKIYLLMLLISYQELEKDNDHNDQCTFIFDIFLFS